MKLGQCEVRNFGSYRSLSFNYSDPGLTLVHGKTGSGKSTLPDIACWALYGVTARGGNVADICSWTADGETTRVELWLAVDRPIQVVRIRGTAKENDLYWIDPEVSGEPIRGKDINDTQKKLVARLGVDADSFITSAYLHEFSEAGDFFTLRAKDRRYLFERIANLDLPSRLAEASSAERKQVKGQIATNQRQLDKLEGKLNQLIATHEKHIKLEAEWKAKQERGNSDVYEKIERLNRSLESLHLSSDEAAYIKEKVHSSKLLVQKLSGSKCSECGSPKPSEEYKAAVENHQFHTDNWRLAENRMREGQALQKQIDLLVAQLSKEDENPWAQSISEGGNEIADLNVTFESCLFQLEALKQQETALDQLYDLSTALRGELLRRTVKQIEHEANRYLETYFDAEIRVEFNIDGKKDDIEVSIKKSGYEAVYTQLSRGQRSLLRLCFSVAVMEQCSNKTGVHQDCLFFDEAADGLDENLKEKVFGLLSELETRHSTVMVIDHSVGFQNLFTKRLQVILEGDQSYVESENNG
jgi:DNA repair exonuclease SbcCD ATPase subunit